MNIKSIIGTILSLVGIIGLLYTVMLFTNAADTGPNTSLLFIYGSLGAILLISGIGLVESVDDD